MLNFVYTNYGWLTLPDGNIWNLISPVQLYFNSLRTSAVPYGPEKSTKSAMRERDRERQRKSERSRELQRIKGRQKEIER